MKTAKRERYIRPECKLVSILGKKIICSSPMPGQIEVIKYEDWEN